MPQSLHSKLIILLMIFRLAQMPIPWLHEHDNIRAVNLSEHLIDWHAEQSEIEHPYSWHLHWIATNLYGPCDQRDNPLENPDNSSGSQLTLLEELVDKVDVEELVVECEDWFLSDRYLLCSIDPQTRTINRNTYSSDRAFPKNGQWRYALAVLLI